MANILLPFIHVTCHTCEDNSGGTLPVLDLQCWTEGRLVKKTMASPYFIMEASALSTNTKWSSLVQEVSRCMKNNSRSVPYSVRCSIITEVIYNLYMGPRTDRVLKLKLEQNTHWNSI